MSLTFISVIFHTKIITLFIWRFYDSLLGWKTLYTSFDFFWQDVWPGHLPSVLCKSHQDQTMSIFVHMMHWRSWKTFWINVKMTPNALFTFFTPRMLILKIKIVPSTDQLTFILESLHAAASHFNGWVWFAPMFHPSKDENMLICDHYLLSLQLFTDWFSLIDLS